MAKACQPIWNVLSDKWRESFYVSCDETNIQVLKENGRTAESKSWMLVRATPFGAKTGKSFGEVGLIFYKQLYDIEENLREKTPDERYEGRIKHSKPIWDEMFEWAKANQAKVPIKSKIGNAFFYFINEFEYLTAYLKDGRLEIDNGFVERAIRKFAIGRNGWLFSDQVEGAHASAVLYSLVCSPLEHGSHNLLVHSFVLFF